MEFVARDITVSSKCLSKGFYKLPTFTGCFIRAAMRCQVGKLPGPSPNARLHLALPTNQGRVQLRQAERGVMSEYQVIVRPHAPPPLAQLISCLCPELMPQECPACATRRKPENVPFVRPLSLRLAHGSGLARHSSCCQLLGQGHAEGEMGEPRGSVPPATGQREKTLKESIVFVPERAELTTPSLYRGANSSPGSQGRPRPWNRWMDVRGPEAIHLSLPLPLFGKAGGSPMTQWLYSGRCRHKEPEGTF